MDIEIILIIIMAVLLLSWTIFCVCSIFWRSSKELSKADFKVHVQCQTCGAIFDVTPKEAMRITMTKTRSTTKVKRQGAVVVSYPEYSKYEKKFYCPDCDKKTYGHIYNLREMQKSMRTPITKEVLKGFAKMIIGGLTILMLMQIPMYFVNQTKQERIEQMKEQ
ncbi:MAG: hypothetical protein ACI4A3_04260 [Lachnospiraceae bacterium]